MRVGPEGGDCSVAELTTQTDIVARQGYWAAPSSDGTLFYKCPIPEACLPGVNGSRSTCAPGYGSLACSLCVEGYFEQVCSCCRCRCRWQTLVRSRVFVIHVSVPSTTTVCFLVRLSLQFGLCVQCPDSSGASAGAVVGIITLLVVVCGVLFALRAFLPVDVLKLGLSMLQVRA